MLRFFIKRYIYAVKSHRRWFWATLLPVLVFAGYKAMMPDYFEVFQDVAVSKNAPFAWSSSPIGFTKLHIVAAQPEDFFLNTFAVKELYMQLNTGAPLTRNNISYGPFMDTLKRVMALTIKSEGVVRISYGGADVQTGEQLVQFYSNRLKNKVSLGFKRRAKAVEQSSTVALSQTEAEPISLLGLQTLSRRALWRADRVQTAVILLLVSVILVLAGIGFMELTDTSFKSERQVARYLGLTTLGALPDLNIVCDSFGIKD